MHHGTSFASKPMAHSQQDPQPANQQFQPVYRQQPVDDPDEINLLEYFYALIKHKWIIILATSLGLAGGYSAAIVKGPSFVAEATIAPKEKEDQKMPSISGFGALGGIVANQLNLGGNASLEKIALVLGTRKFNGELVEEYKLLPFIYKHSAPERYAEFYDSARNSWKDDFDKPDKMIIGDMLSGLVEHEINENAMTLTISSKDSLYATRLIGIYIEFLDNYLRKMVQEESQSNEKYLTERIQIVSDVLLREKILSLIAQEEERQMLVSKEAFKVIDPPFTRKEFKAKKLYPIVFGFGLFFITVLFVVFGHAFTSADKTEEDKLLLEKIKREATKLPLQK
ncbi:MAG: hypothetical protein GF398_11385 [Chitinivibrionales bacterium]|nr:hypothetical protein [Chitinivibrionales bacterium]